MEAGGFDWQQDQKVCRPIEQRDARTRPKVWGEFE